MGQSPEELRGEIARTRGNLSNTLDAIGDHVSPGRIMERRKNKVVQGVQSVRDRVMGTTSDVGSSVADGASGAVDAAKGAPDTVLAQTQGSPLVAGALAFGVGFLVAAAFPATRTEAEAASQLMDKAQPARDSLVSAGKDAVENLKDPVSEAVGAVKDTAASGAEQVKATAQEAKQSAQGSPAPNSTDAGQRPITGEPNL